MTNRPTWRQIQEARYVIIFQKANYYWGIRPKEQDGRMKEKTTSQCISINRQQLDKEFTASKEIILIKEKYLAFKSHGQKKKEPRGCSNQYVVLQPFIPERAHPLFIIHLIMTSRHTSFVSVLCQCQGQGLADAVYQSELKELKYVLRGYDVCVSSFTIIQHLCSMYPLFHY